jgi:transcription elongation factor Elf1
MRREAGWLWRGRLGECDRCAFKRGQAVILDGPARVILCLCSVCAAVTQRELVEQQRPVLMRVYLRAMDAALAVDGLRRRRAEPGPGRPEA